MMASSRNIHVYSPKQVHPPVEGLEEQLAALLKGRQAASPAKSKYVPTAAKGSAAMRNRLGILMDKGYTQPAARGVKVPARPALTSKAARGSTKRK